MARKKGTPKTGGRKKGTPNKTTLSVKKALTEAFEGSGGTASLIEWAKENRTEFYKIWAKLLPQEIKADISGEVGPQVQIYLPDNGRSIDS